jgi:hypothetical protein
MGLVATNEDGSVDLPMDYSFLMFFPNEFYRYYMSINTNNPDSNLFRSEKCKILSEQDDNGDVTGFCGLDRIS